MTQKTYDKIRRKTYKRKVTRCKDGDTFVIDPPIEGVDVIRLSGVDTPEMGTGIVADKMTKYLNKLVLNKKVKLTVTGYNSKRGYWPGRWVCEVSVGSPLYATDVCDKVQKRLMRKSWRDRLPW